MRLTKERTRFISVALIERLHTQGLLQLHGSKDRLINAIEKTINNELSIEDQLNVEIREILSQYNEEFKKGLADYQKMFRMVKEKLVKERGLVL